MSDDTPGFVTKDSGERKTYGTEGMKRDTDEGKPDFTLVSFPMLQRKAELLSRGASKYGRNNYRLANDTESFMRFKQSAARHFFLWLNGDRTEDHGTAAGWNIDTYEDMLSEMSGSRTPEYDWRDPRLPERFWAKVDIDFETGCWVWRASKFNTGYGAISWQGTARTAHSVSWDAYNGAVDDGLELDHLCRNRACVSPYHLEPVTHQENVRRGAASGQGYCRAGHPKEVGAKCLTCSRISSGWMGQPVTGERTQCPEGHEYSAENTWVEPSTGRRRCKICKRDQQRAYRAGLTLVEWRLQQQQHTERVDQMLEAVKQDAELEPPQ